MARYPETDESNIGKISHGQFTLLGQKLVAMNSGVLHDFSLTEGSSLVVDCDLKEEIGHYWNCLTKGGEESQYGWLRNLYGASLQIVPSTLVELMRNPERENVLCPNFYKWEVGYS